ncbi:hypothetical protein DV738_g4221, partial [Chaetothyriales sp. CBS 135597]
MVDAKSTEPPLEGAPLEGAPPPLTRRALFDLTLEDMRRRGEPTEGMSQQAPTLYSTTEDSDERFARLQALVEANGVKSPSPSEIAERDRQAEIWRKSMKEKRRRELEYLMGPPIPIPLPTHYSRTRSATGSGVVWPRSHPTSRRSGDEPNTEYYNRSQPYEPLRRTCSDFDAGLSDDAYAGSTWRHSNELRLLQEDMIEAAKFRPERRELFRTFDMNAFSAEFDTKIEDDATHCPSVPADFPPHRTVDGLAELGTYLASSAYIVSLGGPPLTDLKYGIIVVPAGEEALLFAGYGDHAVMSTDFKEQVYAKSKVAQREQEMELRQKAADEWANGVGSEPEIDDDDRAFYRRRWRERKGLPTDSIDDMDVTRPDRDAARRQSTHEPADDNPACSMHGDAPTSPEAEKALIVPEPDIDDNDDKYCCWSSLECKNFPTNSIDSIDVARPDRDKAGSRSTYVPGDGDPVCSMQGDAPASSEAEQALGAPAAAALVDSAAGTPLMDGVEEQHLEPHGTSISSKVSQQPGGSSRSAEVPVDAGARVEHIPTSGSNEEDGKVDGQTRTVSSTDTTVRNAAQDLALSSDARNALERLLGARAKRKRRRRVLDSLLKKKPDRIVARRSVLLEVARAATSLASGELCENPGIDQQLWETVQMDLALKAPP